MSIRPNPFRHMAYHMIGTVLAITFIAPLAWAFLSSPTPAAEARQPTLPRLPTSGVAIENYLGLDGYGLIDWGAVQSGVTVMMIPCVILFLLLQRYYVHSLTTGAAK